jgi:primosomal protein N' (replication factor Y)
VTAALFESGPTRRTTAGRKVAAAVLPVARVWVDVPLAHLDRPFDYLVPADAASPPSPGLRVRVRFAGQAVGGFIAERVAGSEHDGPARVPRPGGLRRAGADPRRGAPGPGGRRPVRRHPRRRPAARGAAPARAGGGEEAKPVTAAEAPTAAGDGWDSYRAGPAFLRALAAGKAPRVVWTALPGEDWPARLAGAIATTLAAGRGALAVVADARDLDRLDAALSAALGGPDRHVALSAAVGPAERYRRFLAASRGRVRAVVGTRAAAFAPVADLGLVAVWDDGDDLHAEPRAPYPHARQVLLTGRSWPVRGAGRRVRPDRPRAAAHRGRLGREISAADRGTVRARAPVVTPTGDDLDRARDSERAARPGCPAWPGGPPGTRSPPVRPVLVQVPRRGYLPSVSCARCQQPARCRHCAGPLALARAAGWPVPRGAGGPPPTHACATAAAGGCGPPSSARGAPPRSWAGRSRHAGAHLRPRRGARPRVPDQAAVVVADAGRRAGRRRRLRRGAAAGHVGPADPGRSAGQRGDPASLARGRRAGPARRGRRPGRRGRRRRAAAVQALLRWDPGWLAGASWPSGGSSASHRRPGSPPSPASRTPSRNSSRRPTSATRRTCSAPSRRARGRSGC